MIMVSKADAIISLRPKAEWILRGDELEWHDKVQTQPSEAEIQIELTRLRAEYDSNEYQRLRAAEYPSLPDQLDMQFHDAANGTTTWQDAINAVKAKYPKPTGA